jgi:hypothetical protein
MRDPNLEWLKDFIEDSINSNLNSKINYAKKKVQEERTENARSTSKNRRICAEKSETGLGKSSSGKSLRGDDCDSNGEASRE